MANGHFHRSLGQRPRYATPFDCLAEGHNHFPRKSHDFCYLMWQHILTASARNESQT